MKWSLINSKNGMLFDQDQKFKKTSSEPWMCATRGSTGWSSGIHSWSVRLDKKPRGISVGISKEMINTENAHENCDRRYDLYCGEGVIVYPDRRKNLPVFENEFRKGDYVTIILDMDKKTLTFQKEGEEPCTIPIKAGKWYPYFAFCDEGAQITIIQ